MSKVVNSLSPYRFVSQDMLDPGHEHNGFPDRASAEYWRDRACGIACMQMVLYSQVGRLVPAGQLIDDAVEGGAYRPGVGWIHTGLATLLARRGLPAEGRLMSPEELIEHLLGGGTAILSVTPTLGATNTPPEVRAARGGHLVLCHGFSFPDEGKDRDHEMGGANPALMKVLISDPDHQFPDRLEGALATFDRVEGAWSGRCIAIAALKNKTCLKSTYVV